MKRINIFYWVFTGLLLPVVGIGSVMGLTGDPKSTEIITSLGYPEYLSVFLCIARILALVAIFVPQFPKLKEWAYAGLVFDITGAIYSLIFVRHSVADIVIPTIALAIVFTSYFLYHKRANLAAARTVAEKMDPI